MLSRRWFISQSSTWSRSVNSLNSSWLRNPHFMSSSSKHLGQTERKQSRYQPSKYSSTLQPSKNQFILQRLSTFSCIGSYRSFSLTSTVLASENLTVTEAVKSVENLSDASSAPVGEKIAQKFASIVGDYLPVDHLQHSLEFIHVSLDLPWYATIMLSTVIIRVVLTPLVVITQRNMVNMQNAAPEMQEIQNKLNKAFETRNTVKYERLRAHKKLTMKEKGFNPIKSLLSSLVQIPIFVSYFICIQKTVNVPVESLHTGGMLWFTDLTLADPYYVLPLITCSTLGLIIHLGMKGKPPMGFDLRVIPIVMFPFIMHFPAAIVLYWASNNFCTLIQDRILRIPRVKAIANIPEIIEHAPIENTVRNVEKSKPIDNDDPRRLNRIKFGRQV